MQTDIKVLGPGCSKCKLMYGNVQEALQQTGKEAHITKIEDMQEIMKYDVLTTPVLMINGVAKVKGRVPDVKEIVDLLTQ